MKSNKIVLVLIFFVIGFLLYHKDEGVFGTVTSTIEGIFGSTKSQETADNPYKAKEKPTAGSSTEASSENNSTGASATVVDVVKDKVLETVKEKSGSLLDDFADNVLGTSKPATNNLPEPYYPTSSQNYEVVRHKAFTLGYSEKHEQAAWTFHRLTKEHTYGNASRDGLGFEPDKLVSTQSALSSDYSRSGYDRGHLVPAGDFKCCQDLMKDTFWVSNLSPENPEFNRTIWNNLEQKVRTWARKYGELYIYTGPVLEDNLPVIGRYNRISVPRYIYKIVIIPNGADPAKMRVKAFLIPNRGDVGGNYMTFLVAVDTVERRTGLDFLTNLPTAVENKIEAIENRDKW